MKFCLKHSVLLVVLLSLLFSAEIVHAQEIGEQKSYTAPRESHEWVFFGNSETSKWEYDQRTLIRTDSLHLRIRIKETPLKNNYSDIRGAKMWEQRSIQGYSDSLRLHPQFYYEGFERYGFTIFDEEIDLSARKYTILKAADYDIGGVLLVKSDSTFEDEKPVRDVSPEGLLADLFLKGKSRNW